MVSKQTKYAVTLFVAGEKLDQERLEIKPLLEKGISEHEVIMENDMSSKEISISTFWSPMHLLLNECAEDKKQ